MADELNVDITQDLTADTSNVEDNGGTRQAGSDDKATDLRSLLSNAFKEDEAGRLRAPDGRFAAREPQEAPQGVPGTPPPPPPASAPQGAATPPDEAALLSSLAPEVRPQVEALLTARETAYRQHVQNLNDQLNGYAPIGQVIGNRVQAWAANGLHPAQAIDQLLSLSDFAGSDPANFVLWFANQHGLDLNALEADYMPPDPQISQLEQRLASIENGLTQRQQYELSQQQQHTVNEVQQFAREVDANGKPVRPYFGQVADDLMQMVAVIKQTSPNMSNREVLQTAYDRAVWANPNTRRMLQEQQQAAAVAEATNRVNKARLAGSSVAGAPLSGGTALNNAPANSVRDELRRAFATHSS